MTDVEVAWFAGLFEGEGTLTTHQTGWTLKVLMTDQDVIWRIKEVTGVGTLLAVAVRGNRKPAYRWATSRRDEIKELVLAMRPWLGERRTARVDEYLAWHSEWEESGRSRPAGKESAGIRPGGCERHPEAGRYVRSGACVECRRELGKRYRASKRPSGTRSYGVDREVTPPHRTKA